MNVRVRGALKLPANCPEPLASFLRTVGTREKAKSVLRIGDTTLRLAMSGKRSLSPEQNQLMASYAQQADQPPTPDFEPWDGAMKTITLSGLGANRHGKKKKTGKFPAPLAELIEKHGGSLSAASRAMGLSSSGIYGVLKGVRGFDEKRQRQVFAALHGVPSIGSARNEPDLYQLDLAVVLVTAKNYERVNDVAELLNGRILFRKQTPTGWLVLYRMKPVDARKFKRIASRDTSDIVCP